MPIRESDVHFVCDLLLIVPVLVDGEGAARYIKGTNNKNATTPIIAVSAYGSSDPSEAANNTLFTTYLSKPVQKADLLAAMRQLGFKTSTGHGRGAGAKITSNSVTLTTSLASNLHR